MKILPLTFKKNGFDFEQVQRAGNIAIFRKRQPHWSVGHWTYETIIIKPMPGGEVFGRVIEPYEAYPTSESWGILALASTSLDGARDAVDISDRNKASKRLESQTIG